MSEEVEDVNEYNKEILYKIISSHCGTNLKGIIKYQNEEDELLKTIVNKFQEELTLFLAFLTYLDKRMSRDELETKIKKLLVKIQELSVKLFELSENEDYPEIIYMEICKSDKSKSINDLVEEVLTY